MGQDSLMVSPVRDDDFDVPMCESPINTAVSPVHHKIKDLPPRVTTVVPASFVPIETDWSLPLHAAKDTLDSKSTHAQVMLGTLDYYRTGVRKGIMHLASLDQRRILGEAAANAEAEAEAAAAASTGLGITNKPTEEAGKEGDYVHPQEMDDMIAAMCAPAQPGASYSVPTEIMHSSHIQFPVPAVGEKPGGRRDHIRQYNEVVENSIMQLAGFNVHMRQQREKWGAVIEREKAAAAAEATEAAEAADNGETPPPPPPPPPPPLHPPLRDPALRKDVDKSGL